MTHVITKIKDLKEESSQKEKKFAQKVIEKG